MSNLRSKRVLVPALAVAVTAVGAGAWTATAQTDDVRGSERDQVEAAVADAVTDGQVTDVEASDDPGEAYDVEVRLPDGSEVDLALDQDLAVVSREDENRDDDNDDADDDRDDREDDRDDRDDDRDDRVLDAGERERAEQAALEAVGSGTATDVEASDDPGEAYDLGVRLPDGSEVDLALDEDFAVVSRDDDRDDRDDRRETDDDRVLDAGERERAEQSALEAVGSGTATDVEASDDRGVTYEVEVVDADGVEWHVDLDAAFDVVDQRQDR